jgi:O-antigen ligase
MITARKLFSWVLCAIPLFIVISLDGSFSIQSILIPILLVILIVASQKKVRVEKSEKVIFLLLFISIAVSLIFNIFLGKLPTIYLIRIVYTILVFLFYYLATSIVVAPKDITKFFNFSIISGFIVSSYFIFIKRIWYTNLIGVRIDKNFTGGLLAIYSEFAFLLFYYQKDKIKKNLYLIAFVYLFIGVFYSGSRASMAVSLIGALGIILEDSYMKLQNKKYFLRTIIAITLFAIAAILLYSKISEIMTSNPKYQWFWNRYFVNSYEDKSNITRIAYWTEGLKLWMDRPIFGHGPGYITITKVGSAVAHNTFIDYMVDCGILGLTAFSIVLYRSVGKILLSKEKTFKALPITLFVFCIILSLNRSVLLWSVLIICWQMSNQKVNYIEFIQKGY